MRMDLVLEKIARKRINISLKQQRMDMEKLNTRLDYVAQKVG